MVSQRGGIGVGKRECAKPSSVVGRGERYLCGSPVRFDALLLWMKFTGQC